MTHSSLGNLRFGVIGWGYWGPKLARNLDSLPHAEVAIAADSDPARLASIALDKPHMRLTTQAEDIFRSDIDGVVIATPVHTHYRLAKAALQHGKHVLVEKPLTSNIAEAEELVALAQQQQRVLQVGHTFEYNPAVNELRNLVRAGDLGNILCIETERLNLGLYRSDTNVIWDLAPHDISILRYLLGQTPERVNVEAQSLLQARVQDIAHLDLVYPGGTSAHIHVSWLHPCKVRRVTVIGDAKMAVYDDTNQSEMLKVFNKGADIHADPIVSYRYGAITVPYIDWIEPLRLECEDFVNCILTGAKPRASGEVGLEIVRVLAAAQDVIDKRVQVSVQIESGIGVGRLM